MVLNAMTRERVRQVSPKLRPLAGRHRLALGGAAAEDDTQKRAASSRLTGDPTAEAARVHDARAHPAR